MITFGALYSDLAISPEVIRGRFAEHEQELRWLATFLTGDDELAEACLVDACATTQTSSALSPDWLPVSPAFSIIGSAMEIQRRRIAELAVVYERRFCLHAAHEGLPAECLEFIVIESDIIRARLDTLCRLVLVLCGVEKWSWVDAGRLLGISPFAVESAYCSAVESLEVIDCEAHIESADGKTAWN